jgi:DNA-directed RNA polymerase specialized sigma24 family protein
MKPVPTLADLLATLPDEERFILTLHYLKGIPAEEIAEKLGVPHKSVLAVVDMGKKRLLAALDFPPFP